MQAELVHLTTADGVGLDGAFFDVAEGARRGGAVDAFLLVHRSGGNFYSPFAQAFARHLRDHGYPCASFNNSGHDIVWSTEGSGAYWGTAYEVLDRCRLDIRAMLGWLVDRGFHRVALVGHNMGATKAVYYQSLEHDPNVAVVVAISPVRLSYSHFMDSTDGTEFRKTYTRAQHLIQSGRGSSLIEVSFPIYHIFSARAYVDKHGPDEKYNLLQFVDRLLCPLLVMGRTQETHTRLRDFPKELVARATRKRVRAQLVLLEGADSSYAGIEDEVAGRVLAWVDSLNGTSEQRGPAVG